MQLPRPVGITKADMAIWHFRISLVPRDAVKDYYGSIPIAIPDQDIVKHNFWRNLEASPALEYSLQSVGPEISSWSDEMRCWGTEDGHQMSVL